MQHDTPLIATVVAGLGLAVVFGAIAQKFRIPPLVGYLLAGVGTFRRCEDTDGKKSQPRD
jgi:predicted Kef-type K+ transport protein